MNLKAKKIITREGGNMKKIMFVLIFMCFCSAGMAAKDTNTYFKPIEIEEFNPKNLIIQRITAKSPVDLAGMKMGDKILSVNRKKFKDFETICTYLGSLNENETVFEIEREKQKLEFKVIPNKTLPKYGLNLLPKRSCMQFNNRRYMTKIEEEDYGVMIDSFVNNKNIIVLVIGIYNALKDKEIVVDPSNVSVTASGIKLKSLTPEEAINIVYAGLDDVIGGPMPISSGGTSQSVTVESPQPTGYTVSGPGGTTVIQPTTYPAQSFADGLNKGLQTGATLRQAAASSYPMERQKEIDQLVIKRRQEYEEAKRNQFVSTKLSQNEQARGQLYFDGAQGGWPIVVKVKIDNNTTEEVSFGPVQAKGLVLLI